MTACAAAKGTCRTTPSERTARAQATEFSPLFSVKQRERRSRTRKQVGQNTLDSSHLRDLCILLRTSKRSEAHGPSCFVHGRSFFSNEASGDREAPAHRGQGRGES